MVGYNGEHVINWLVLSNQNSIVLVLTQQCNSPFYDVSSFIIILQSDLALELDNFQEGFLRSLNLPQRTCCKNTCKKLD